MESVIKALKKLNNAAIFTHVMPDGDAFGSALSLREVLKDMGKDADVYISDNVPKRLLFMSEDYLTSFTDKGYDTLISLDAGDLKRLSEYGEIFKNHQNTISIDHHKTNSLFAKINYVVPEASSTGEVLYDIFKKMGAKISKKTAEHLYCAIASDTGCFKFSSTGEKGHLIAADLIKKGIDFAELNRLLFDTEEVVSYKLKGYAMNKAELHLGGKVSTVSITKEDLKMLGADFEHTEGLSDVTRVIEGVEVGIVLKEKDDLVKVSIRTNRYVDATVLASTFGGGGHIRASGCVSDLSIEETKQKLIKKAQELIKE